MGTVEVDINKVIKLAENAEDWRAKFQREFAEATDPVVKAGKLNDYFYWAGKATSYRGIIAMAELQTVVEDELDAEARCP